MVEIVLSRVLRPYVTIQNCSCIFMRAVESRLLIVLQHTQLTTQGPAGPANANRVILLAG